jgi:hypothetical protein
MILARWSLRASGELRSSIAPSRAAEVFVLALRRFDEFRRGKLAASYAAVSMVVQLG